MDVILSLFFLSGLSSWPEYSFIADDINFLVFAGGVVGKMINTLPGWGRM